MGPIRGESKFLYLESADTIARSGITVFISDSVPIQEGLYEVDLGRYQLSTGGVIIIRLLRGEGYIEYISESGTLRLEEVDPDRATGRAAGRFDFTAALFCGIGRGWPGVGPPDYPDDAPRIHVRGQFRADRDTTGVQWPSVQPIPDPELHATATTRREISRSPEPPCVEM